MRKAATSLAILLLLAVGGLVLVPQFIDINRFKGQLAAELGGLAGRDIEIGGPLKLSLLPGPKITIRDLRIANPPGAAAKDMVRLRALEVKLGFWRLLSGAVEIRQATLIEPELDLERLASGDINWQAGTGSPGSGASPAADRSLALAVDRLVIQDGAVTYRSGATTERFEHINATVGLGGPSGPFDAAGELATHGAAVSFEAHSGKIDAATVPMRATATIKPAGQIELDGALIGPTGGRHFDGKLRMASGNLRALAATLARAQMPAALAQPFTLSADVTGSARMVMLDQLSVDLGSAHCTGKLKLTREAPLGIDLSLSVGGLDLDRWLAGRKSAEARPFFGNAWAAAPDATAPVPSSSTPSGGDFALPQGIKARFDFGAEAILWRNGVLRQGRLQATLADGRLTIDRLAALLPGGSEIAASGGLATPSDGLRAQGLVRASADDLRSLLAWLGVAAGNVPADRLRTAALSGRFSLAGDRLDVAGIDATIDATRLNGAATVILRERPGVGVRLVADRLNLDAYLPDAAAPANPAGKLPAQRANGSLIQAFDTNLDARVEALTWRGQPLGQVHLAGTLQNGDATIRELSIGDLGGGTARLSGAVQGLADDTGRAQIAFEASGPEFERVLRIVSPGLATGRSYGDFRLDGSLQLDGEKSSLTADLDVLQGRLRVSGDASANTVSTLDIAIDHPSFAGLVRHFSPDYRPAGGDPGPFRLAGRLTGTPTQFAVDRMTLAIGESTLEGRVAVSLAGVRPRLSADVTIGDWAIDRLLGPRQSASLGAAIRHAGLLPGILLAQARATPSDSWSHQPIDLDFLRLADIDIGLSGRSLAYDGWRVDQPALSATLEGGTLTVKRLAGSMFGGSIEASGSIDSAATPAFRSRIAIKDADLKRALVDVAGVAAIDGRIDIDAALAGEGQSAAEMIGHLGGDAAFRARDGAIAGIDLAAVNARLSAPDRPADLLGLLRTGTGGRTPFAALQGHFTLADGIARSDDIRLAAEGGDGKASASFDLPQWMMTSRIELRPSRVPGAPPLVLRFDGPIDQPNAVFEVNALQKFLQESRQR